MNYNYILVIVILIVYCFCFEFVESSITSSSISNNANGNTVYEAVKSRILWALILATAIASRGYKKKSLSNDGAIVAWCIGVVIVVSGWIFAVLMLSFYFSSSYLTKYKSAIKKKVEEDHRDGGQRNYIQVLSNSLTGATFGLLYLLVATNSTVTYIYSSSRYLEIFLLCAALGHYAACNGDTWASELGVLNKRQPILVTTFKTVPAGTNGGISPIGTLASIVGGTFIGLSYYLCCFLLNRDWPTQSQLPIVFLGTFAGFFGSLLDSILGATLQYSGWNSKKMVVTNHPPNNPSNTDDIKHITGSDILDNHQVNFLSSFITSIICGFVGCYIF
ncbi:hypothetical protein PPL_03881 [Heterostelium album PN500]|uniref:Transmembrane protein 19 n=1 Tax=Heterostelium pallidum (strain ATCC 26659 / Pp 5 / PN500) TaxID=670386 RepID=D3B5E3_HETP5|nr:hypothetical protein PPL_03881 [Heterostelium album PN500]EFA83091.1 hypothetical protein PPL_03881 [Heterostelium album PN500]|eukprot:XP_020435208.1 hypothetical protein PPL_03881 [Heterostelium album PN500]